MLCTIFEKLDTVVTNKTLLQPPAGFPIQNLDNLKALEGDDQEDVREQLVRGFRV